MAHGPPGPDSHTAPARSLARCAGGPIMHSGSFLMSAERTRTVSIVRLQWRSRAGGTPVTDSRSGVPRIGACRASVPIIAGRCRSSRRLGVPRHSRRPPRQRSQRVARDVPAADALEPPARRATDGRSDLSPLNGRAAVVEASPDCSGCCGPARPTSGPAQWAAPQNRLRAPELAEAQPLYAACTAPAGGDGRSGRTGPRLGWWDQRRGAHPGSAS